MIAQGLACGDPIEAVRERGPGGPFTPATLSLTGWWKASYTAPGADPRWSGTASAGTSGSNVLNRDADADAIPTAGTTVNGLAPAHFNDVVGQALETGVALSSLFTASAGTLIVLAQATHGYGATAGAFNDPAICIDRGAVLCMTYSNSGVGFGLHDGAQKTVVVAASASAYHAFQMKWDGAHLFARVDSGAWQSVAAGNLSALTGKLVFGKTPGVAFLGMDVLEVIAANTTLSDGNCTNVVSYLNSTYGVP